MMAKKKLMGWILSAVLLFAAGEASAKDFTITVPVRLYNMVQGVGKAKVTCEVLDDQGERIGTASKWSTHHVNQYPTGLEEDIVLEFDASPGKDPRNATSYKCDLKVQLPWVHDEPWQTPSQNTDSMYLKAKPGTEFRVEDSGPLYKAKAIQKPDVSPKMRLKR